MYINNPEAELTGQQIKEMQYENLRKHFDQLTDEVLGPDYYNMGMDVRLTCFQHGQRSSTALVAPHYSMNDMKEKR